MLKPIGKITAAILGALSLIHIYWALGGSRGLAATIPTESVSI